MINDSIKKIWADFWAGKNSEPVYAIKVPKNGKEILPQPPYLSWFNGDFKKTADEIERWYESSEFYGAAIPYFNLSFGADDFAAFVGCDLCYAPYNDGSGGGTSWAQPILKNLKNVNIRFDPDGKWWNRISEFHYILKQRFGDAVMISPPTLSANLDALSALYGQEPLLLDLIDSPELVKNALDQINAAYTEAVKACVKLFDIEKQGSVNRHGAYSSGFMCVVQCDFSCMISPQFFDKFAVPAMEHEFSFIEGGEYHLDGPGALKHLDRLLKVKGLDMIQWVSGSGFGETQDWTDLYRRVLKSGRNLLMGTSAENAENHLKKYKSKNIYLTVHGIKTKTEAEDFLSGAGKLKGHYDIA